MRLEKLIIENYKGIERAELIPEPDVTLVIGINGAGKTSLAEAIRLLGEMTQGSDTRWLKILFPTRSREGFIGCLPWRDSTRWMAWTVTAVAENGPAKERVEYRLALRSNPIGDPTVAEEEFRVDGDLQLRWDPDRSGWVAGEKILMTAAPGHAEVYPFVLNYMFLRGTFPSYVAPKVLQRVSLFTRWMSGWKEVRPEPLDAGRSLESLDPAQQTVIGHRGENYAAVLFNWKNSPEYKDRWEFVHDYTHTLLRVLGLDLEWDLWHRPLGSKTLVLPWIWRKGESHEQGFDLAYGPDGLRQWLMVLTAVCAPEVTLLVLEEPELHLDPRMMDLLVEAIRAAVKTWPRQIIITTHSPLFACQWPIRNIRLIEQGVIRPVPEGLAEDIQEERLRLLDAWMMDMLTGEFRL
jgi:energy-coupling factor transporter ATP-binding protein EcfA2